MGRCLSTLRPSTMTRYKNQRWWWWGGEGRPLRLPPISARSEPATLSSLTLVLLPPRLYVTSISSDSLSGDLLSKENQSIRYLYMHIYYESTPEQYNNIFEAFAMTPGTTFM